MKLRRSKTLTAAPARAVRVRLSKKAGSPPGTPMFVGTVQEQAPQVQLIEYDAQEQRETKFDSIQASRSFVPVLPHYWLNVHGLQDAVAISEIGTRFGLHPLTVEDILNTEQRTKIEDFGHYIFVVLRVFDCDHGQREMHSDQVSIVLGANFVLTFQERQTGAFDQVRGLVRSGRGLARTTGSDYLAYLLLDAIVDRYFVLLEQLSDRTEALEDEALGRPTPTLLAEIYALKREMVGLRRSIWPLREVINTLTRGDNKLFQPETLVYMRDVYDHTVHVVESIESTRDMLSGMLDLYVSSTSNRINQEMRLLTVITTIVLPLTLITGVFGMNFKEMPLLEDHHGFAYTVFGMVMLTVLLLGIFKRRGWMG